MLRHNVEGIGDAVVSQSHTKIRKRCALSSSGASNPVRKLRSKRGVLLRWRERGGGGMSPCSSRAMSELSQDWHCHDHLTDGVRSSLSARKLVNAIWQVDKDRLFEGELIKELIAHRSLVPRRGASTEMSKKSRSRSKILEADWKGSWFSDMMSNSSTVEVGAFSQDDTVRCSKAKTIRLRDLYNSLIASKELVKVLTHVWGPRELNPSTVSLLSSLRSELDLARAHARRLVKEQDSDGDEINGLKKQLVEEMESWKSKQKEKVATVLQFIVSELENEKKSRKRAERINKKLGAALANTQASLQAATKELEKERKSKVRVEKICNELIRGIGEDKAEVEAMRRETEKAQQELQKEREMLQIADEWRETRVQMKLSEARFQFEEKNAAINRLRDELEAVLETKKEQEVADDQMQLYHTSESGGNAASMIVDKTGEGEGGDESENEDSEGSDMHSIELNVDGNGKSISWSYTPSSKDIRRDVSRHGSFSNRGMEGADFCGFDREFRETNEEMEGEWEEEGYSNGALNLDQDAERYQAIKNLREQMLAGSGFILSQGRAKSEREFCGL